MANSIFELLDTPAFLDWRQTTWNGTTEQFWCPWWDWFRTRDPFGVFWWFFVDILSDRVRKEVCAQRWKIQYTDSEAEEGSANDWRQRLRPWLVVAPESNAGFWTAGMSHSSVEDSLLKNPVSPFILPTSGGSEEKQDELEYVQEDELGNYDEDELEESHDMMENGLFGQEEELEEGEEAREGKTSSPKGPFGRANANTPAYALPFQELVSTMRGWKSEELAFGHPYIACLVENVADIINKFEIGHDGRTAYERLKGKTYKGVIHEFGSVILHHIPEKTSRRFDDGEMGARCLAWEKVYHRRTHNCLENGKVVRTRNVRPNSLGVLKKSTRLKASRATQVSH